MIEFHEDSDALQIHYYLSDKSHSMNAYTLNKAENELLKIIGEVSKILDIQVVTEAYALEEGGIKEIYKFVLKHKKQAKYIGAFLAGISATIISDVVGDSIKTDAELEKLKKEELRLSIEKLKRELEDNDPENTQANTLIIENLSIVLAETNKIKISKSNFYNTLLNEEKISKVSTQELDRDLEPIGQEKIVPRADFNKFIIEEAEIEDEYLEQVELEIVSPVLRRNRSNWKAIYNENSFSFKMKDNYFQELVITRNLSFSNGTSIICDLETSQKLDMEGEIIPGAKRVYNVSAIIYKDGTRYDVE
ncbi:conserved hypothetical protein [Zunongwangia profunda SM-A87]|uniref:Uncharacterized protein n=1 Tax=Zunongwangia profunda (strain DSM 18752 / CCTCC AB 206139 / SM-A87) TaxID=655815 RepID=D5B9S7_ZUNPS|nr:hypothetical protein [Zunongwangia profunda]ADF54390.1 conserved hypothetical protein [Zunongwangia profunda SM-A87]